MSESDWVQVEVKGLLPTPSGAGVFLAAEGKIMSVFVDAMVAHALEMALKGERASRPLTHDLLLAVVEGLGVTLKGVWIHGEDDGVYFARLGLQQENELGRNLLEVDARPSDSLVLALRFGVPVRVAREVWERAEDMSWAAEQIDPGEGRSE